MIKHGYQITCNGCGCTTFLETHIAPRTVPLENGTHTYLYDADKAEKSWSSVNSRFDLCPRCQKIHEEMLCKFYEKCGEARDNEN